MHKNVEAKFAPLCASKLVQFNESLGIVVLEPATQLVPKHSLKEMFHVPAEGSPTKKAFKCKTKGRSKKAKFAHKDKDNDNPFLCEVHTASIEGAYKAAGPLS